ncbi:MAG: hypothetical protein ABIQ95_11825 [Bdellovibrionia bacterium]
MGIETLDLIPSSNRNPVNQAYAPNPTDVGAADVVMVDTAIDANEVPAAAQERPRRMRGIF